MIEEEQAKIDLEKKKNKNKKGWVEPLLESEKLNPRFPDAFLCRIFQWRLSQNDARYRGYILDGFPRNYEQSVGLLTKNSEDWLQEEALKESMKKPGKASEKTAKNENLQEIKKFELFDEITPQTVIFLHGTDDFFKERCKSAISAGNPSHFTEESLLRRSLTWKRMNEENPRNIMNFCKNHEFDMLDVNCEDKKEDSMKEVLDFIERVNFFIFFRKFPNCATFRTALSRPTLQRTWRTNRRSCEK